MSQLYINEPSARIGIADGRITIKFNDGAERSIPVESVEGISLFGPADISTGCMRECLEKGIDIQFYSTTGGYYGKVISTRHVNVARQRQQAKLGDNGDFCLSLAKRIIKAKIHNQTVVLRRYNRNSETETNDEIKAMRYSEERIDHCLTAEEVMGFEGNAARSYYKGLGKLTKSEFAFGGRSKRPPLDPFNSMLSLGYTILMYAVYGALESRGLNPYFGFLHSDREKHPTLASDMMEEWRAVIVDSVVMSMVNGNEIGTDNFYTSSENGGVFMDKA